MYLNVNYPVGIALVANILALVCHIVQFVIYVKYQNPNNWSSSIPAKYIMTFVSGADSCLTAYYFIRAEYVIKKKSIAIILVTIIINAVTIGLNSVGDKTEPWADDSYVGGMYYSQCGSLTNSYSKLRCQLIDATYIALIVSVVAWIVAIFGRKESKRDVSKPADIERPPITSGDRTSSTLTVAVEKRSSKPPKQKPVVTMIDEEEEKRRSSMTTEKSRLLITTTKTKTRQNTRQNSIVTSPVEMKEDELSEVIKMSSTEKLPLSIHDDSIKPLGAIDATVDRPIKYGRRASTLTDSPTLTKVNSSSSLKKDLEHINEE